MDFKKKVTRKQFLIDSLKVATAATAIGIGINSFISKKQASNQIITSSKHTKEALFYSKLGENVKCELCPHECSLVPDAIGICKVRQNKNGHLMTNVYGNPCAVHVDPIEKKPMYHFIPSTTALSIATAGCNLHCLNCQNWQISQSPPTKTRNQKLMPDAVVNEAKKNQSKSIAYTYSEPIVFYEYMYDTAKLAKENKIKNVFVSAGYINEKPLRQLCKFIDGANIDLKSFSDSSYRKLNSATLKPVLNTLHILKEEKVWFEITNLIVPKWTDDLNMIKKMTDYLVAQGFSNYPLHFSRFFPMFKLQNLPPTPIETLKKAKSIALKSGIKYVYIGNVPNESDNTYCHKCGKLAIERKGYKILQNNIKNGKCPNCNETIPGVWA